MIENLDDIIKELKNINSFVYATKQICPQNSSESLLAVTAGNKLSALIKDIIKLQHSQNILNFEKVKNGNNC